MAFSINGFRCFENQLFGAGFTNEGQGKKEKKKKEEGWFVALRIGNYATLKSFRLFFTNEARSRMVS